MQARRNIRSTARMASQLYRGVDLYADLNEKDSDYQDGSPRIRLLDLRALPARTRDEDTDRPIEGTLRVVPLYYSPRYAALSYVWGQKPQTGKSYTVRCGDVEIAVSKNCLDALSCICERFGELSIWVDSICINQDDPAELEGQLPFMGEIYSQAHTVFVWLGPENVSTDAGLEYSRRLAQRRTLHSGWGCSEARTIQETLRHKWFQRGWTFQELIMANNLVFLTESQSLTWNDILRAKDQLLRELPRMPSKALEDFSASVRDLVPIIDLWKSVPFSLSGYEFWTYLLIVLEV